MAKKKVFTYCPSTRSYPSLKKKKIPSLIVEVEATLLRGMG